MSSLDDIKETFFIECQELLEEMEAGLIEMSEGGSDSETVNAVFRAAHSIKGGAGAFAFNDLVSFAHRFETTLDEVRSGRLEADAEVMAVFLRSADRLADLVAAAQDGRTDEAPEDDELLDSLSALAGISDEVEEEFDDGGFEPMSLDFGDIGGEEVGIASGLDISEPTACEVTFVPFPRLTERGNEPALLLRSLMQLEGAELHLDVSGVGTLDDEVDQMQLSWRVVLAAGIMEEEVTEIFEFVEGDCDLRFRQVNDDATCCDDGQTDFLEPMAEADNEAPLLDLGDTAIIEPLEMPDAAPQDPAGNCEPEVEVSDGASKASPPAESKSEAPSQQKRSVGSIRVELERVDRLINLVGELVVNQAMLSQSVVDAGLAASSAVATGLDEFKNLTREVQDSVMAIRAQPVRSLFQRMSRIVREAASATGKTVKLKTEGEATEIDKTVIDLLADPLTHMIRNAVDHGLEGPEDREAAGKNREGVVTLTAAHRSGRVVIEIADDGAGINRERVHQIAISKGLVDPEEALTPSEIDNLLFMPGFSTAETISNLSGRGVGMDVVKQAIQKLGGRIAISSSPGKGSVFSISLPLTLAVLDGMIVGVDEQTLVVPLTSVVETLRPDFDSLKSLGSGSYVLLVRGIYVPVVDVGFALGFSDIDNPTERNVFLLIEGEQAGLRALALDSIIEQRQVVIKSLEDNYGHVEGVAAATILGNGRISLILDPDSLISPNNIDVR